MSEGNATTPTDDETNGADTDAIREAFETELATHERLVLCLDFDGTLAPIVQNPDDAAIRAGNRESIRALRDHPAVTVAVVSGRALDDVRGRVGVDGIGYVGNAGLERVDGDGIIVHPDAKRTEERLERVREALVDRLGWASGVSVEDKRWSLAVHTRDVPDDHQDRVAETVGRIADRVGDLHVSRGHEVLEVGPDTDANKGAAVAALADSEAAASDGEPVASSDALVVYVGDDQSDQSALRTAAERGIAVYVGEDGPDDAHHVASPEAVSDLLDWLATEGVDRLAAD
ncbi:trehalose-phosphatase [Halomarina salina]|uniref:Trehalose 6-phosphate phosphatase n=1 Tax=Halomarina salina TaxID=1872699 RepID=A0ABD5RL24_9EURY|nr:trehalose-phosphatase [Halomarina salina]